MYIYIYIYICELVLQKYIDIIIINNNEIIIPYISSVIPFWQRAFLRKRDRQELTFTLKAEMDDFRHKSTRFIVVFIDFADAFGSVKHEFIFETLSHFGRKNEKSVHV